MQPQSISEFAVSAKAVHSCLDVIRYYLKGTVDYIIEEWGWISYRARARRQILRI